MDDWGTYFDELTGGGYDYGGGGTYDFYNPPNEAYTPIVPFDYDQYYAGLGQTPTGGTPTTTTGGIDWAKLLGGLGAAGLGALGSSYAAAATGGTDPKTTALLRQMLGFGQTAIGELGGISTNLQNLAAGQLAAPSLNPAQQVLYNQIVGNVQLPQQTLMDIITQGTMPTSAIGQWQSSIQDLANITPQKTAEMLAQISPLFGRSGATEKVAMENLWKLQEEIAKQKQGLATTLMPIEERQRATKAGAAQQLMSQYPGMMGLLGLPETAQKEQVATYFQQMQQPTEQLKALISAALGFAPTTTTTTGQAGPSLSSILLGKLGGGLGSAGEDILKNLLPQILQGGQVT